MSLVKKLRKSSEVARYIWDHPANRDERLQALSRALAWQLYKRTTGKPWTLDVFNGMKLVCYPDTTSGSAMIYGNGYSDYHEMLFLQRYLRPGDHVLDVGANIGVYTLLMASLVGETGRVDSFEASPDTIHRLRENIAINELPHVQAHHTAVGTEGGTLAFTRGLGTVNHLVPDPDESSAPLVEVPVIPLDDFLSPTDSLSFIKVDIEGAELLALQGAEKLLERHCPRVWLLEINGMVRHFGHSQDDVEDFLRRFDYETALYDAHTNQLRFVDRAWRHSQNVFAISRKYREEVCQRLTIATI